MINLKSHRDRIAEDIRRLIQHELNQFGMAGPYIILASESTVEVHENTWGMTSPDVALVFKDEISDFRGNGPGWVVNDSEILRHSGSLNEASQRFAGVCAHELAHRLDRPRLCEDEAPKEIVEETPPLRTALSEPIPRREVADRRWLKAIHSPSFIRLAIHVRHRLRTMGWQIWTTDVLRANDAYAAPGQYFDALRPELKELEQLPLSEINGVPEPPTFARLREEFLEAFFSNKSM